MNGTKDRQSSMKNIRYLHEEKVSFDMTAEWANMGDGKIHFTHCIIVSYIFQADWSNLSY